jgi:hypothetical protein
MNSNFDFTLDDLDPGAHRDRLRTPGLASGRIPNWTQMSAARLWREWLWRFDGNADRMLAAALDLADRLAREHSEKKQADLRRTKRALLRDAFSEDEYSEPVGPEERARLALPFKGLLKMLKHVAVQRAGFRPWEK